MKSQRKDDDRQEKISTVESMDAFAIHSIKGKSN